MKKLLLWIVLAFFSVTFFTGCTAPAMTKPEVLQRKLDEHVKNQNYLKLARYWDINAEKLRINLINISHLTIWESEGKAEIAYGVGPYYGMIELIKLGERKTKVVTYAWGYLGKDVEGWRDLIMDAPED